MIEVSSPAPAAAIEKLQKTVDWANQIWQSTRIKNNKKVCSTSAVIVESSSSFFDHNCDWFRSRERRENEQEYGVHLINYFTSVS